MSTTVHRSIIPSACLDIGGVLFFDCRAHVASFFCFDSRAHGAFFIDLITSLHFVAEVRSGTGENRNAAIWNAELLCETPDLRISSLYGTCRRFCFLISFFSHFGASILKPSWSRPFGGFLCFSLTYGFLIIHVSKVRNLFFGRMRLKDNSESTKTVWPEDRNLKKSIEI